MSLFVTEGKVLTKAEKQKLEEISKDTEAKQDVSVELIALNNMESRRFSSKNNYIACVT